MRKGVYSVMCFFIRNIQHMKAPPAFQRKVKKPPVNAGRLMHAHPYYNRVLWWHKGPFSPHLARDE